MQKNNLRQDSRQAGNGSVIAIIIIVIVLIVGAIYMWAKSQDQVSAPLGETEQISEDYVMSEEEASSTEATMLSQSDSDEISTIESDLSATSYEGI